MIVFRSIPKFQAERYSLCRRSSLILPQCRSSSNVHLARSSLGWAERYVSRGYTNKIDLVNCRRHKSGDSDSQYEPRNYDESKPRENEKNYDSKERASRDTVKGGIKGEGANSPNKTHSEDNRAAKGNNVRRSDRIASKRGPGWSTNIKWNFNLKSNKGKNVAQSYRIRQKNHIIGSRFKLQKKYSNFEDALKIKPEYILGKDLEEDRSLLYNQDRKYRSDTVNADRDHREVNSHGIEVVDRRNFINSTTLNSRVAVLKRVSHTTSTGKKRGYFVMVLVGNYSGCIGMGQANMADMIEAISKATSHAVNNLVYTKLYDKRTIVAPFCYRVDSCEVEVSPLKEGGGLDCPNVITEACMLMGIKDIKVRVRGSNNPVCLLKAFIEGLRTKMDLASISIIRGYDVNKRIQSILGRG